MTRRARPAQPTQATSTMLDADRSKLRDLMVRHTYRALPAMLGSGAMTIDNLVRGGFGRRDTVERLTARVRELWGAR